MTRALKSEKALTRAEKSWIGYDWANSVYATIIMAALFPIYFGWVGVASGFEATEASSMWAFGTSIATAVVAILAPVLGAFADFAGMKKKLLISFILIGTTFTFLMAITDHVWLMLVGYVLSYIGFTGANLFYDSFLTDVTTKDRMDKISSLGFSMGYVGGSTIAFLIALAIIYVLGFENWLGYKIAAVITSVWWMVFSIPMIMNVKQIHYIEKPPRIGEQVKLTFKNIFKTFMTIVKIRGLLFFIIAYFFYIDGVNSVIHLATSYGTTLELDPLLMVAALLVTQIVAIPFTILFGYFARKVGSLNMILIAVCIYALICGVGFYMGYMIEIAPEIGPEREAAVSFAQILFFVMATLVGTVQGGIQALSRSFFGRMIPANRSNEFFGFFDIFGKFAAVMGPAIYGAVTLITGSSATGIVAIGALFITAFIILVINKKTIGETEKTGIQAL
ncbi:MAG: MFS transporter [Clostridiaceae bacterium]|nr:MFS transporter [Clostridiaceae bacterium]